MSPTDDSGPRPEAPGPASSLPAGQVHSQLVEALVHLLIEKGVLTKNDALSIVHTVAQVKQGEAIEGRGLPGQIDAEIHLLQRMYSSFEALPDRGAVDLDGVDNVHQLRPPIHDPRDFPRDD